MVNKAMWTTRIKIATIDEIKDEARTNDFIDPYKKMCENIQDKDTSFDFKIHKPVGKDYRILDIYSADNDMRGKKAKDIAHKRGTWMINKLNERSNEPDDLIPSSWNQHSYKALPKEKLE